MKGEEFVSTIEARLFKMDVGITTETGLKISKLEDILKEESRYGIDILDLLDSIDDEGNVSLSNLRFAKGNMSKDKFNVPEYGEFIDRTAEMNALRSWYEDESPLMLVTGQKGMGKTVLAAHFCQHDVDDKSVLWFDIPRDRQAESLLKTASHFFEKMGLTGGILSCKDFVEILICAPVILVVDGYYEVEEEMVDLMIDIVRNLKMGVRGKILVTSPTGTPSYSRFFTLSELESGKVRQMVLKGVDDEGARHILGTNTSSENLRKIYLLTKHNPSWLVMIKNEDENGLLEKTRLTKEEIRLLFFWKR
ncbi:MAG TPA: ATP-binding protein [Euryarchaeota archaeon]|nr:ATP-binding protein [Euryarchaeota archaeon]